MSLLQIYKQDQGKYTRIITFLGVVMVGLIGAVNLSRHLSAYTLTRPPMVRFGIPTLLVVALAGLLFWIVNRPRNADFMIATESEMKKVSWSSRKEIVGSTKVVILTTFIMAAVLFGVDVLFVLLFRSIGVSG